MSFPSAKNARDSPSGDQNGDSAFSEPPTTVVLESSSLRVHSILRLSASFTTTASVSPSGEMAGQVGLVSSASAAGSKETPKLMTGPEDDGACVSFQSRYATRTRRVVASMIHTIRSRRIPEE